MKVFIKEQLFVLDYKDEIVDCIFNSDDHNTPGYAYNISIEDSNTGYSNLSFTMPTRVIPDGESEAIHNPKLTHVKPLTKIRYERQVIYTGDDDITVSIPVGYGDTVNYQEVVYHKGDLIDLGDNVDDGKFKMDYIIQPLDKKRSGLEVSMSFTAIDYPRFNLSKKKLGSTINENTITRGDWSIYEKTPMSVEGTVQYVRWTQALTQQVFGSSVTIPLTWDPSIATGYTLTEDQINTLLQHTDIWTYGVTATIFYWPITQTGRYEGVVYDKGDYLTLSLYEKNLVEVLGTGAKMAYEENNQNYVLKKYTWVAANGAYVKTDAVSEREYLVFNGDLTDTTYLGSIYENENPPVASADGDWYLLEVKVGNNLDFYGYTWGYYDQGMAYLTPNNPCNYLNWTLENTNWTIKLRTDKIFQGTHWNSTSNFPTGQANGYLMYKSIKDDEKPTYVDTTNYTIYTSVASIPTTGVNASQWAIVSNNTTDAQGNVTSSVTNIYHFNEESKEWYLSRDDVNKIDTKFYIYENNTWTLTSAIWTSSIDLETGVLYDVDQVDTEIAKPDAASGELFETTQLRSSLSASDSNCYNIITELCKSFQLYPVFDCINRTVALRLFCGKNFGLTYKLGKSLENTTVKEDGEKVITKLRCYGGTDAQGSEAINLGDANRQYRKIFVGYYTGEDDDNPPAVGAEGFVAIIDDELDVDKPWIVGQHRKVQYLNGSTWTDATNNGDGTWSFTLGGVLYTIDEQAGTLAPWDPNDDQYIQARSPYGTEYIYNFKWMYDNGWMTKEDILGLYQKSLEIQTLNKNFLDSYSEDYKFSYEMSVKAGVDYQANQDEYLACLNSMMNTYYKNPGEASSGTFNAFHRAPADTYVSGGNHYLDMFHCYSCEYTSYLNHNDPTPTKCPQCFAEGSNNIQRIAIKIPVYGDTGYIPEGGTSGVNCLKGKGFYYEVHQDIGDDYIDYIKLATEIDHRPFTNIGDQQVFLFGSVEKYDTSSHMYNWNDYVEKWQHYYQLQLDDLRLMNNYIDIVEALNEEYNQYTKSLNDLENYIQDNWGDYIVEGRYKDETICYSNILLAKSLEASTEYCIPKVTYTASVVDSSGLIEYRIPMAETYNDLVHSLHNVGQIVPKAGDYTTLIDEQLGLYGVPAVITSIKRSLDNPQSNSITVDTSYTDNEELVGNIITATNTVLNNSDIYARTAILKADGTIESASLNKSLEQNSGENIAFVGAKGSSLLDSSGLVVSDPSNITRKMKYAGNGIFGTYDNGTTWSSMITPNGINANYIYAGSIDTKHVQIMSGKNAKVVLDNLGLAVKDDETKGYHLPTGTVTYGSTTVPDWDEAGVNLAAFIGVDRSNNPQLYVRGQLVAKGGSKIGNWIVGEKDLYDTTQSVYLSPGGDAKATINSVERTGLVFRAGNNFGVTKSGTLYSNSIEAYNGVIGGFTLTTGRLYSGTGNGTAGIGVNGSDQAFWAGNAVSASAPFRVDHNGNLTATSATIKGNITATTLSCEYGTIGGWAIGSNTLSSSNVTLNSSSGNTTKAINVNNGTFYVQNNGYVYGSSGKIGGWELTSDHFKGNTTACYLYGDGRISMADHGWINGGDEGYWMSGNGSDYPCLIADDYTTVGSKSNIKTALGTGMKGRQATVGIHSKNGPISIRCEAGSGVGGIRIATTNNNGIALNAGTASASGEAPGNGGIAITCTDNLTLSPGGTLYIYDNVASSNKASKTGYIKFDHDGGLGWNYAIYANGILIGVTSSEPSGYTKLNA